MFLEKMVRIKEEEIAARKAQSRWEEMKERVSHLPPPRDFLGAIGRSSPLALIAEVKRASPSAGVIQETVDLGRIASQYQAGGACAVSVLTEPHFFHGELGDLAAVQAAVSLPLLQKDFIIDPFQVYEGRIAGADALLLIAAALEKRQLWKLVQLIQDLGLTSLLEVHEEEELEKIEGLEIPLIGINNRNLKTLEVNLETTLRLIGKVPPGALVVSESGIKTREDVRRLKGAGVRGLLVGETLMRAADPASKIRELMNC